MDAGEFDSYFDDAVIIGDSLTKGFSNYIHKLRSRGVNALGEANFMGTASMSVKYAHRDRKDLGINFSYKGRSVSITGGINAMGAKKAFILLGLNDLGYRNYSAVEENYAALIEAVQEKCPDTAIVIQAVFPVTYRFCRERGIKIERWNSFNDILKEVCADHGAEFYDFTAMFMDENGYMVPAYASGSFHMSEAGDEVWHRALRIYAAQKMYPDAELLPEPTPEPTPALDRETLRPPRWDVYTYPYGE